MNKPITPKEMMNQTIQKLINDYQEILDRDPMDQMEDTQSILTRFTKLIVKECSVALNPMLRDMISRGQAYDLIKQHFGVEE